jgi:hypothetical protein
MEVQWDEMSCAVSSPLSLPAFGMVLGGALFNRYADGRVGSYQ